MGADLSANMQGKGNAHGQAAVDPKRTHYTKVCYARVVLRLKGKKPGTYGNLIYSTNTFCRNTLYEQKKIQLPK